MSLLNCNILKGRDHILNILIIPPLPGIGPNAGYEPNRTFLNGVKTKKKPVAIGPTDEQEVVRTTREGCQLSSYVQPFRYCSGFSPLSPFSS